MTIDEFKKNIAPHMNKGFVAMDENVWMMFDSTLLCICILGDRK